MPEQKKIIIVHNVAHATKVLKASRKLGKSPVIASPPNAASYMGIGHFRQICKLASTIQPGTNYKCILDCGNSYAMSMAAMQKGFKYISINADSKVTRNLSDLAKNYKAKIMPSDFYSHKSLRKSTDSMDIDTLDLLDCDNLDSAIEKFLKK
ncbi:MAG: hypothetical protein GY804_14635 [Alphaproteobacteria bacterium]|nr:hypothetical protein [Alphaproteobacteria bacterium]